MNTWIAAIAAALLVFATVWLAVETRRLVKQTTIIQALSALQDTRNTTVREWARQEIRDRLKALGVNHPEHW